MPRGVKLPVVWRVVPRVHYVIAGSGRGRWLLLYRCGWCRETHVAHAHKLRDQMRRKTACKQGYVILHASDELAA